MAEERTRTSGYEGVVTPSMQSIVVKIIGATNSNTIRITSDKVSLKDIELVLLTEPKLLSLRDEDKKPTFLVSVGDIASADIRGVVIPRNEDNKINFTVNLNVANDDVFKYTAQVIAQNLTKVIDKVKEQSTIVKQAVVEVI